MVMRDIQRIVDEEALTLSLDDNNPVNLAKIAVTLNDPEAALRHWRDAMVRCPAFAKTNKDSLDILIRLQLLDEAEDIMRENMKRHPAESFYAGAYAQIAQERKDFPEALKRWKFVMKRHPSSWKGHVSYAVCLCHLEQSDEADKILTKAIALFADEAVPRIEWARNAERRNDYAEALVRWENTYARFKHVVADIGIAQSLEALGRLEEAEARLLEERTRWPLVEQIRITLAQMAYKRGDMDEALRRWADLKIRMPLLRFGYEGELRLLRDLGRFDEAEDVIRQAKDRFPHEAWPDLELAATERMRKGAGQATG